MSGVIVFEKETAVFYEVYRWKISLQNCN